MLTYADCTKPFVATYRAAAGKSINRNRGLSEIAEFLVIISICFLPKKHPFPKFV